MSVDGPPASGSLPIETAPSLVGQTLDGRYRILKKLGEGGMGEVYAAEHIHIEKRFAIKLLRPEIVSNAEAVQRFRQEARSSSSIGHRNIIAIEDFGQLPDGRIYMCMELLNGAALNDMLQTPQPVDRMLNILIQTGHGLAAAHAKGIVHRDMKPENIFVTIDAQGQDVPKLLDFGIAKVAGNEGQNNLTRTGTIFGTPFYMAPEQALGNPVDARTDIYAVGVIMYEVFAGSLPFQGESFMGILTQHITTEPEPVAQRAAKAHRPLPPGLAEIITRCMQKNPAQRFSSMDELVGALVQIYRAIAGAGMSTYMEAFPVSARMPAPTPPPLTGGVMAQPTAATVAHSGGYVPHGHATPGYGAGPTTPGSPTGPSVAASASGLHDPGASVTAPRKSKTGLIIAIAAVVVVGAAIAAIVVLGSKKQQPVAGAGSGSQIAALGSDGSSAHGGGSGAEPPDHPGSNGSAGAGDPTNGSAGAGDPTHGSGDPQHGSGGSANAPIDAGVVAAPVDAAVAQLEVKLVGKNVIAFEVYEDGKKLFDGPDDLMITPGTPRTVVIKARGFKDKKVVVDGKKPRLELRLDRKPGERPDPPPTMNCSAKIIDPTSQACVEQYCAKHPDEVKCTL